MFINKEGYGLTAMEAMACGAAVASTNYENCLLSPVRIQKLWQKI